MNKKKRERWKKQLKQEDWKEIKRYKRMLGKGTKTWRLERNWKTEEDDWKGN